MDIVIGFALVAVAILAWVEQRRVARLESSPALQIQIERAPWECPHDPEESVRRWNRLSAEQKFRFLVITNKGRGPATLESLCYADGSESNGLENAHLPLDVGVRLPCEGFVRHLMERELKDCYVIYTDPHGRRYRQWFRVNTDHMTAAPLRLEKVAT
jgi:hypothetical protein